MSGPLLLTPKAWVRRGAARLPGVNLPSPLRGRTVLVTGASSGIGEATALAVAARGAVPLLVARRADELARVAHRIERRGGAAFVYPCDLTDAVAANALVRELLADHGGVDMLVNNAGRSIRRSLALSYDRTHDFERTMAINFLAPVRLILGLLPQMVERRSGHVVNVVTWGVQVKAPKFAAYIASKTALDAFSRIAGRETYGDGVTFTNVRLPLVRTDMIGPTDAYRHSPAMGVDRAAARVVRALEDRPLTINTVVGNVSEVLNLVAPRLSDAISHAGARRFPDSAAAAGPIDAGSGPVDAGSGPIAGV
ncbi:MAG TPA: SDR family NAD(P)-dependent oxidoreductase [Nocardioidaceae bacterium]|nr:SDR family NAD(P)-dependent oxidoreductase [Nocardioidaceae bacterium]